MAHALINIGRLSNYTIIHDAIVTRHLRLFFLRAYILFLYITFFFNKNDIPLVSNYVSREMRT